MSKYTLYTYYNTKILEKYDKRTPYHIRDILLMETPDAKDFFGRPIETANRFEIRNNKKYKIFDGNISETLAFVRTLK